MGGLRAGPRQCIFVPATIVNACSNEDDFGKQKDFTHLIAFKPLHWCFFYFGSSYTRSLRVILVGLLICPHLGYLILGLTLGNSPAFALISIPTSYRPSHCSDMTMEKYVHAFPHLPQKPILWNLYSSSNADVPLVNVTLVPQV